MHWNYPITYRRGDTLRIRFRYLLPDRTPFNLTGYQIVFTATKKGGNLVITSEDPRLTIEADGLITLTLTPEEVSELPHTFKYEFDRVGPDRVTLLAGVLRAY